MSRNDLMPRVGHVAARGRDLIVNGEVLLRRADVLRALGVADTVSLDPDIRCAHTQPLPLKGGSGQPPQERITDCAVRLAHGRVLSVDAPGLPDDIRRATTERGHTPHEDDEPGFYTSAHRFVSRHEAAGIAVRAGQVDCVPTYLHWNDLRCAG